MPTYNSEKYINDSVKSILNQTFTNYEFIIIDDASNDKTVEIIESYDDSRILLIKKNVNSGLTESLNMGIKMANGKYIARMDSDDISLPQRFEFQYQYMERHPKTLVLGTKYKIMFSNIIVHNPVTNEQVKIKALTDTPIGHPTAFIRREVFTSHNLWYNKDRETAEDYDLWCRILEIGEIANLNEVLLEYRTHDSQTSEVRKELQKSISNKIREEQFYKVFNISNERFDVDLAIRIFQKNIIPLNNETFRKVKKILNDFNLANLSIKKIDEHLLSNLLRELWLNYLFHLRSPDLITVLNIFFVSEDNVIFRMKFIEKWLLTKKLLRKFIISLTISIK